MKLPKITALLLAGSLTLAVAACGKPTVDGADKRYKTNKDKISVLITKQPANKLEFEKKVAEFEAEYTTAMAAGSDEEKIKKLGELNSRMDKYLKAFDDKPATAAKAGGQTAPSNKLDGAAGAPAAAGAAAAPAAGGKLGGTAQPASGGMGGTAQPAAGGAAGAPAAGGMGGM